MTDELRVPVAAPGRFFAPREPPAIVVGSDSVLLPSGWNLRRVDQVSIDDLIDVEVRGNAERQYLVIATLKTVYAYVFPDAVSPIVVARSLLKKIGERHGPARLAEMDHRHRAARRIAQKRPIATWTLLGLIAAGYALELMTGALGGDMLDQIKAMLRLGASNATLVRDGEWFRLFTANFLHGGFIHLYFNGMALLFLGALIERLIGPTRMVAIYLIAALAGAAASVLFSGGIFSIGASTAIFGLLGALGAVQLKFGKRLPYELRRTRRWWVTIILINSALPLLVPIIDVAGHIGGAAGGLIAAMAIIAPMKSFEEESAPGWPVRLLALSLSAATVGSFAWAAFFPPDSERALHRVVEGAGDANALNALAWDVAIDPRATASELATARRLADRAVAVSGAPEPIDTLATVLYRQGDFDEAVRLERRAIALDSDPVYYAQLARFLGARVQREGPIGPEASIVRDGDQLRVSTNADGPVEVFALFGPPARPRGMVRLTFDRHASFALPAGAPKAPLVVALVERTREARAAELTYYPWDSRIAGLPAPANIDNERKPR